ncbi:methyltransferase-like protein 6 isoform X3 [Brachypodium distachyon]|uniref:Methyltransferase-like protein n=1 Tax=Brachypodium distachyon TaxID=15368 RepID=A0A0Q3GMS1_BRADI|nr:methyltransferase-like protein 6 isoform X3 [Brachypodium distachyon]KQJ82058.1 hypothetical protein BRADI_5g05210v3 [Brachypodium distachyon]|eukprot:XP_010239757.1 methyltransferase-like protein 6 isoform X3 [Brachypodium distachyon]
MEGGGERDHEAEPEYHCHDFEWEDLRADVEANPSFSHHLSPFPTTAASPSPSSEAWRSFHRRHASGRFFKERRYLLKEFPDLLNNNDVAKMLEVGCGNGSTVVPILRCSRNNIVYACDCSKDTLEKANEIVNNTEGLDGKDRFHPFLLDVSKETFPDWLFCKSCQMSNAKAVDLLLDSSEHNTRKEHPVLLKENQCCVGGIDAVTMRCVSVLKPGGLVLFRDYGLYDMTMLRFSPSQRVGFREYMRADGTFSYFFTLDTMRELFHAAGLLELELEYCCVRSINRKNGKSMQRVWVHGKFQKPTR